MLELVADPQSGPILAHKGNIDQTSVIRRALFTSPS